MPIVLPRQRIEQYECARCHNVRTASVWVVSLRGDLTLHAECAAGLYGDLDADLDALRSLATDRDGRAHASL